MISQIGLTNFKCFQGEHNFPLSRFNLLTGINGRGKSTLLQSLLLMKQTTDYDIKSNYIILNGSCVQLGSFEDIKNSFSSNEDEIKFVFKSLIENNEELKNSLSEVISRYELGLPRSENLERDSDFLEYLKDMNNDAPKTFTHEVHYTFEQDDNDDSIAVINEFSHKDIFDKDIETRALTQYEDRIHLYYMDLNAKTSSFYDIDGYEDFWYFEHLIPIHGSYNEVLFKYIQFISADRLGPKNFYQRQNVNQGFRWIGARGENVASILFLLRNENIHTSLYLGEDTNTLLQQQNYPFVRVELLAWVKQMLTVWGC